MRELLPSIIPKNPKIRKMSKTTKVVFKLENNCKKSPLAVFPDTTYNQDRKLFGSDGRPYVTGYTLLDEHCAIDPTYYESLPDATPEQYAALKEELIEYVGYNLEIGN